jgi:hypothetical protein
MYLPSSLSRQTFTVSVILGTSCGYGYLRLRINYGLQIPAGMPPGNYEVIVRPGNGTDGSELRDWLSLAQVEIDSSDQWAFEIEWPLETTMPQTGEVVEATYGPGIQLYATELDTEDISTGDVPDLTIIWQAMAVPERSYHVFVHMVEVGDDENVTQSDKIPVDWLRPTNGWRSGEALSDHHLLELPSDIQPGANELLVGFYDPDDDQRLPIFLSGGRQPDDRLLLAPIRVWP